MEGATVGQPKASLWRDSDFLKFWSGESLSMLGAQVSLVAIPLLAVTWLNATPFQMGLLNAAEFAPFLLFTLVAGVWVDRTRRLPLLIGANLGRAVLVGLIPLATASKMMDIGLLCALVFLAGALTVIFDLAYQSFVPSLVSRERLIEANGRLEGSRSFAQMSGPGVAGILVSSVTAPVAIVINAVTYLISAVTNLFIRRVESPPRPVSAPRQAFLAQIGQGLNLLLRNTYLCALGAEAAVYNLFNQVLWAVLVLHLVRGLHFPPAAVGIVLTMSGVGAVMGSVIAARFSRRWGLGPTLIGSIVIANTAPLLIPLASGGVVLTAAIISLSLLINGIGLVVYNIQAISVRQASVSSDVLGRTNAGYRFAVTGTAAIGAIIGGVLGELIGLRATMVVGAVGTLGALWFVIQSPIPRLRDLSEIKPESVPRT